eukprot:g4455.t1
MIPAKMIRRAFASKRAATHSYPLLPHEWTHNLHDTAPGTADFFASRGKAALTFLQQRCEAVLSANPWLAARLVSEPEPAFVVPKVPSPADHQSFYAEVEATFLGHETTAAVFQAAATPGPPLSTEMTALFSKKGIYCVDADEPLFKVRAITAPGGEGFMVTTSMSHVLGDGSTMYQVHAMLHPDSPVVALSPQRLLNMPAVISDVEGAFPGSNYVPAASLEAPVFDMSPATARKWEALHASEACTPLAEGGAFEFPPTFGFCNVFLDEAAIARHKKAAVAQGEVTFVSTNDVFTAWLFQASKAALGTMAYNTRPLLGSEGATSMGNYQVCLAFAPTEFSAASIRSAVNLPGVAGDAAVQSGRVAFITSWTQAHKQLDLSAVGATHRLHQPLMPMQNVGAHTPFHAWATVYKPVGKRVAVQVYSSTFAEDMHGAELLGDPVI